MKNNKRLKTLLKQHADAAWKTGQEVGNSGDVMAGERYRKLEGIARDKIIALFNDSKDGKSS